MPCRAPGHQIIRKRRSSTHKQATDAPLKAGRFFSGAQSRDLGTALLRMTRLCLSTSDKDRWRPVTTSHFRATDQSTDTVQWSRSMHLNTSAGRQINRRAEHLFRRTNGFPQSNTTRSRRRPAGEPPGSAHVVGAGGLVVHQEAAQLLAPAGMTQLA